MRPLAPLPASLPTQAFATSNSPAPARLWEPSPNRNSPRSGALFRSRHTPAPKFWRVGGNVTVAASTAAGNREIAGLSRGFAFSLLVSLIAQHGFAAQTDFVAFDRQHLHQHLIAFLQRVAYRPNALIGDFADVQQPIGAGENFD